MSHETEIVIPNGKFTCKAVSEILKKTKCYKCQKDIYIVYTTLGPKLPVSKIGDKLMLHDMECPFSEMNKEAKKKAAKQKEYEKSIASKWSKPFRRKQRT